MFLPAVIVGHTSADRLFDVQHAREAGPAVLVPDRFGRSCYPADRLIIYLSAAATTLHILQHTPFSCSMPLSDEHPGPPNESIVSTCPIEGDAFRTICPARFESE
jgi:hypothetical protein